MSRTSLVQRKSSNLENVGVSVSAKAFSHKVARVVSQNVFRDASARRRNRVLSGIKASKPEHSLKRHHIINTSVRLITPPASPVRVLQPVAEAPCETSQGPRKRSMPVTLPRQSARPIDSSKLAAIDPEVADVPVPYIRDGLALFGPQYVFCHSVYYVNIFTNVL